MSQSDQLSPDERQEYYNLLFANSALQMELRKLKQVAKQHEALRQRYFEETARSQWIEKGGDPQSWDSSFGDFARSQLKLDDNFQISGWDELMERPGTKRHLIQNIEVQHSEQSQVGDAWHRLTQLREQAELAKRQG